MASVEILLAFLATSAAFAFLPGPALLYTAAQTLARGRRAGLMAALGLHLGGYVHVIAAAAGLSVLFHAVPQLYVAVKLAGALYLIWLGIGMIRAKTPDLADLPAFQPRSGRRALVQSITIEVLNPKTAIFFVALLPQFIDAAGGLPIWVQFLILGGVVNALFSCADLVTVLLAGAVAEHLRKSSRAQVWLRRAGGGMIAGLGLNLALQRG